MVTPRTAEAPTQEKPREENRRNDEQASATMPTHANAWFRRLGRGREFVGCSVMMPGLSVDGEASVGFAMA